MSAPFASIEEVLEELRAGRFSVPEGSGRD